MQPIACTGHSEARGRNRWFQIAEAGLTTHAYEAAEDTRLCLHVYSQRHGQIAPVVLVLTVTDAAPLAQAVLDAVQQVRPVPPAVLPCCPRCQATESLASGACNVEGPLVVRDAACLTWGTGWHDLDTYQGSSVQEDDCALRRPGLREPGHHTPEAIVSRMSKAHGGTSIRHVSHPARPSPRPWWQGEGQRPPEEGDRRKRQATGKGRAGEQPTSMVHPCVPLAVTSSYGDAWRQLGMGLPRGSLTPRDRVYDQVR